MGGGGDVGGFDDRGRGVAGCQGGGGVGR